MTYARSALPSPRRAALAPHRLLLGAVLAWAPTALAGEVEEGEVEEGEAHGGKAVDGEEMVVTATRTEGKRDDSPVAVELITRADIEASGAESLDELLDAHPGVELTRSFAGASIRLQGLSSEHVLILVDGQRVIGRKNGAIDLSRYPVEWIERVEIVKGPASALYGSDAMGGVVNVILRRADKPLSVDAHGAVGSIGTLDASGSIGLAGDRARAVLSGGYHRAAAYDLDPSDLTTDGSARQEGDAAARVELRLGPDWRVETHGSYLRLDSRAVSESGTGAVFDQRNLVEEARVGVAADGWLSGRDRLQLSATGTWYRDQYDNDQRSSDALDSYEDTREQLGQAAAQLDHHAGRHLLTVGLEGLAEHMRSDRLDQGEGDRTRFALFAQDAWTLGQAAPLVLLPGARVDVDSWFGAHVTPRLAVRFDPTAAVTLRAGVGLGYRAPDFKELLLRFENPSAGYEVVGNPDLQPETSRNLSLGVEVEATQHLGLGLAAFYNDVDGLITEAVGATGSAGEPTSYTYVNIDRAITRGGEATATLTPVDDLDIDLGYALTDTRDLGTGLPLEGRARHRGTLRITGRVPAWGLSGSMSAAAVGARPFYTDTDGDGQNDRFDAAPYGLVDARLSKSIGRTLNLSVGVENALDTGDADWLPLPPRSFTLGLAARFPPAPSRTSPQPELP